MSFELYDTRRDSRNKQKGGMAEIRVGCLPLNSPSSMESSDLPDTVQPKNVEPWDSAVCSQVRMRLDTLKEARKSLQETCQRHLGMIGQGGFAQRGVAIGYENRLEMKDLGRAGSTVTAQNVHE
jgi:hypothetical protein